MGHQSQIKALRHQLRDIAKEHLPAALTTEILVDAGRKCAELTSARMDDVAKQAAADLKKIDSQTQGLRAMLTRDLGSQVSNELYNISTTMVAFMEVINDKIKLAGIDLGELGEAVEAKKIVVKDRMQREAREAQMKADKEAKEAAKLEAEAKAAKNAVVAEEAPVVPSTDVT